MLYLGDNPFKIVVKRLHQHNVSTIDMFKLAGSEMLLMGD